MFRAFQDLWDPMWNKHAEDSPDRWNEFARILIEDTPSTPATLEFPAITRESWLKAVRGKKAQTSTGPDGVSRMDLLRMPPSLVDQLVRNVSACEQGLQSWPQAELAHPIIVLTIPYDMGLHQSQGVPSLP